VTAVQNAWKETWPEKSFDYFFLNSFYDQQFKSEIQFGRIFLLFAAVAVFIACLGILGMTLFEANARLKEFSIRKVLGASVVQLLAIVGRIQLLLITLATMISIPVIYFGAVGWLNEYPVQMPLSTVYFIGPLGIVLIIVLITSGLQAMTAATVNPVEHLKNE
jgi:putative ABC transport system permease protein